MTDEFDLMGDLKKSLDDLSFKGEGLAEKSTSKQRAYIYSLCNQIGIDVESLKYNMKDLTKGEASELIEELEFERDFYGNKSNDLF